MKNTLKALVITVMLGVSILWGDEKLADTPAQSQLSEKGQYTIASKLYIQNEDKKSSFFEYKRYLKHFPDAEKAPKAQFMLGECLFTEAVKAYSLKQASEQRLRPKTEEKGNVPAEEAPFIPTFEKAMEEYQKVAGYSRNEISDDALFRIAECYYNKGSYDKAIETFRELANVYPDSYLKSEAVYSIALCLLIQEKWEDAANILEQLCSMYPAYAPTAKVQFALGLIAYFKNDIDGAYERFKNVNSAEGYYYSGRCLDRKGRSFAAIVNYRKVVVDFPKSEYVEKASYCIPESFYFDTDYFSAINSYKKFMNSSRTAATKRLPPIRSGVLIFFKKIIKRQ